MSQFQTVEPNTVALIQQTDDDNTEKQALRKTDVSRSLLSYEEATALCIKTKWKAIPCNSGEQCWCRLIVPETEIEDKDGNEIYIAGSGCVPKFYAEHIVKLHNESLNCG